MVPRPAGGTTHTQARSAETPRSAVRPLGPNHIALGPNFELTDTGLKIAGRPSLQQWAGIGEVLQFLHLAVPYAIGDWLAYGEGREEWRDKIDQAMTATGLSEKTLRNYATISRHVEAHERKIAPSVAHAGEVAALPRAEQTKWLEQARTEGWTRGDLRTHIKTAKRLKVIEGQAVLAGQYRCVLAAPWAGVGSDAMGLTVEDVCKLPVQAHVAESAVLFLRVPPSMVFADPGPREVMASWGFEAKTQFIWNKVLGYPGNYSFVSHELIAVGGRGDATPDIPIDSTKHQSVQTIRCDPEEADTPDELRRLVESLYPTGRCVELFARTRIARSRWSFLGADASRWTKEAAS